MKVCIRTDASFEIATGHVMRCLTLADALAAAGAEVFFVCRAHRGNMIATIGARGYRVETLPETATGDSADDVPHAAWLGCGWESDAKETLACLPEEGIDWLVVDHYALDARWEEALRLRARHILVIDDLADRPHDCDILLDQTIGRETAEYAALMRCEADFLLGAPFALLRPEFAQAREKSFARRGKMPAAPQMLVFIGGMDPFDVTGQVLEGVAQASLPQDCSVTVVMGAQAPFLEKTRAAVEALPIPARMLTNVADMASLMAESDMAIGAAGTASWERCCLGLPSLVGIIADNQKEIALRLHQKGYARNMGSYLAQSPAEIAGHVAAFVNDNDALAEMSRASAAAFDGLGVARVVRRMTGHAA